MTRRAFDLDEFLPYLLNRAAESASGEFAGVYRAEHGMTRTQWRVMAHLAQDGSLSAAQICRLSHLDKTKVSRAVAAMEGRGWLTRAAVGRDRRVELLTLTPEGQAVHAGLAQRALVHQRTLAERLGPERMAALTESLRALIAEGA